MFPGEGQSLEKAVTEKVPRLLTPLCLHTGKLMASSLILNMGLCQMGEVKGHSLRLSMSFASQAVRVVFIGIKFEAVMNLL